jgi:cytidine deaminase
MNTREQLNDKNVSWEDLLHQATKAMDFSYSPYSQYKVGAALLAADGQLFTGCNIENVGHTASCCAERTAIFKAVSEGVKDFVAIAVATVDGGMPCGVCRQVMREFSKDLTVIVGNTAGKYEVTSLDALLPNSFGPEQLLDR